MEDPILSAVLLPSEGAFSQLPPRPEAVGGSAGKTGLPLAVAGGGLQTSPTRSPPEADVPPFLPPPPLVPSTAPGEANAGGALARAPPPSAAPKVHTTPSSFLFPAARDGGGLLLPGGDSSALIFLTACSARAPRPPRGNPTAAGRPPLSRAISAIKPASPSCGSPGDRDRPAPS